MTCADLMGIGGRGWGPSPGKSPKTIGFLGILVGTPWKVKNLRSQHSIARLGNAISCNLYTGFSLELGILVRTQSRSNRAI